MKLFLVLALSICLPACNNNYKDRADGNKAAAKDDAKGLPVESQPWKWSDSLDAVTAAPANHKIVYEDSAIRVLMVVCPPGKEEAVHTHRYKSTMWFTNSAHLFFYNYAADANNRLVKTDSAEIKGFPAEILNKGQQVDPEGPHSIRNVGTETFIAYRVEYKKDL